MTVLIFKDNDAARVFKVPMRWIVQFGWLLGALIIAVVIGLTASALLTIDARLIRKLPAKAPSVVNSMTDSPAASNSTNRISELEQQVQTLQQQLASAHGANVQDSAATEPSPLPIVSPEADLTPGSPLETAPSLFQGLPDAIQATPAQVPIKITSPQVRWAGKMLKVKFGVQYVGASGSQQGRIIILARGPSILLSHPENTLSETGHKALLDPNHGEYFSVSRFRETRAEFGPISNPASIKNIEVIVISQSGQLLIHQMLSPRAPASRAHESDSNEDSSTGDNS
ncbi:MAG: hypothetical protein P4M08_11520 [Oligoflexia bacterium]|nr:hypothetical protein [Oligoflexia bacterium]